MASATEQLKIADNHLQITISLQIFSIKHYIWHILMNLFAIYLVSKSQSH